VRGARESAALRQAPHGLPSSRLVSTIPFDLWADAWREKVAKGNLIVVRYADDLVVGFEHRTEAEQFLVEFKERLAKFGLELHGEKTRLIEFGRHAEASRSQRGEGKPETFTFLGFTHICAKRQKTGTFLVLRRTDKKKMRQALTRIRQQLEARMHDSPAQTGAWLQRVLRGYYGYFAVPFNHRVLSVFRYRLQLRWRHVLRRRSQRNRFNWRCFGRLCDRWLPIPKTLHPYPEQRFNALYPR
jgi:hypothetical protein